MKYIVYIAIIFTTFDAYFFSKEKDKKILGNDFFIYYQAAGDDNEDAEIHSLHDQRSGWMYPNWTRYFWKPARLFSFETSYFINCLIICICLCWTYKKILHYANKEYEKWFVYAIFIASMHTFTLNIQGGNIVPILALLCLSPFGCILASCFKLWCLVFLGIHYILSAAGRSNASSTIFSLTPDRFRVPTHNRRNVFKISHSIHMVFHFLRFNHFNTLSDNRHNRNFISL